MIRWLIAAGVRRSMPILSLAVLAWSLNAPPAVSELPANTNPGKGRPADTQPDAVQPGVLQPDVLKEDAKAESKPEKESGPAPDLVNAAIARAVAFLRAELSKGNAGEQSLTAMALLKTGLSADDPMITGVLDKIKSRVVSGKYVPDAPQQHVYESGVSLMALANANPGKYKSTIAAIADYLISQQGQAGDWDYPQRTTGDTSMSQYAVLGLWEATRSGVVVPTRVWDAAAKWHLAHQLADGSFTYHPDGRAPGSHSMTVAGVGSLHVIRMHLYPQARDLDANEESRPKIKGTQKKYGVLEPIPEDETENGKPVEVDKSRPTVRLSAINKSIEKGVGWLSERFSVNPPTPFKLYYLYGLERMTALADMKTIASHDWYAEGAADLLGAQSPDGAWSDQTGRSPASCFGILFLSRATAKLLGRRAKRGPAFGAGLLAGGRGLPQDLSLVEIERGKVKVRKPTGQIDELLAELEKANVAVGVEAAQDAIVESVKVGDPEKLISQRERLLKLVRDPRAEVRRTALWALGRSNDVRIAPLLIEALQDPDLGCMIEARNALRFISKKVNDKELPDEPTARQRADAVVKWRKWYRSVRPYDERDDLAETFGQ